MGAIVGSRKQEEKISELGALANRIFPDYETMLFKGSFRYGVRSALEKSRFQNWEEVSKQSAMTRSVFFQSVLDESFPHLKKMGLSEEDTSNLICKLKKENKKYLK